MIGRERVEEHDTIVFVLTPRRDAKPKTRVGELRRSGTSEFSGYRKYSVDTSEGFIRSK